MSGNTERVRAHLNETLLLPATQNIDFWVNTVHVDPTGFREVAYALFAGGIKVDIDPAFVGQRKAEALYDANQDRFVVQDFRYGSTYAEKGTLVHESVHAMGDLRNMIWVTNAEEEVAAYVAEMLFHRYHLGTSVTALAIQQGVAINDPIRERADKIGDAIANQKGAAVSLQDFLELGALVAASPTYHGVKVWGRAGLNGLKWLAP